MLEKGLLSLSIVGQQGRTNVYLCYYTFGILPATVLEVIWPKGVVDTADAFIKRPLLMAMERCAPFEMLKLFCSFGLRERLSLPDGISIATANFLGSFGKTVFLHRNTKLLFCFPSCKAALNIHREVKEETGWLLRFYF